MAMIDELRAEVALLKGQLAQLEMKLNTYVDEAEHADESVPNEFPTAPLFTQPPGPMVRFEEVAHAPAAPRRTRTDLESVIGGNCLNKIGAATLILGMAFFLIYAIDNDWIGEIGRIIIGLMIGMGCIGLGERFQRKSLPQFAQGLSGAGVAILYFTTFAAYSFYLLIPQLPAFVFLAVITAVAIALSVRYDAKSIAALGILSGFLTPILMSGGGSGHGGGSEIGVLIYIAILDLGILGITRFKNWRGLNVVSLIGTAILFTGIMGFWDRRLGLSIGFATLYYLIFAAQAYVQNVTTRRSLSAGDFFMAIIPPVLYFWHCYAALESTAIGVFVGPFAVVMAAIYVALSHKVFLASFEDRKLCAMYLTISAAFLTIAVPIQLRGYWVVWGWGVEAAILSYIGFQLNSPRTRYVAIGIFALAALDLFTLTSNALESNRAQAFSDLRLPIYLVLTALISFVIYLYHRKRDVLSDSEQNIVPDLLVIGAAFLLLVGLSVDVYLWAQSSLRSLDASVILTLLWLVYGLIAIMFGIQYKHRPIRLFALTLLGAVLIKTYLSDVWMLDMAWRIIAFMALGVMLLVASYLYQKYRPQVAQLVSGDGGEDEQE